MLILYIFRKLNCNQCIVYEKRSNQIKSNKHVVMVPFESPKTGNIV